MKISNHSGVGIANADVMSWTLRIAGSAASASHPAVTTHDAIPATKRRAAAAPVASVNRGTF